MPDDTARPDSDPSLDPTLRGSAREPRPLRDAAGSDEAPTSPAVDDELAPTLPPGDGRDRIARLLRAHGVEPGAD